MSRNRNRPAPAASLPVALPAPLAAPGAAGVPAPAAGDVGVTLAYLWKLHDHTSDLIRFADAKSSIMLALASGILSVLFGAKIHYHFTHIAWAPAGPREVALATASLVSLALLGASIGVAIFAIAPRLGQRGATSLIFWQGILEHSGPAAFLARLIPLTEAHLIPHVAEHLFILSAICRRKYTRLRWSIWLAALGGVLGGMVVLFT